MKGIQIIVFSLIFISTILVAQENVRDNETVFQSNFDYSQVDRNWIYMPDAINALLYDNGPAYNVPGGGAGGADLSLLESTTLGMNTLGAGHQFTLGYRMADDFVVPGGETWNIDSLIFYAYQTNSTTTSTITGVYFQIWDGDPSAGGSIIWGDLTTNRLSNTYWSNIYRASETTPTSTARPMMRDVCATPGLVLTEGTYWIDWSTDGTLASGPWAPPIAILGQTTTGNALQYTTAWAPFTDSGTLTPQGLPFEIWGTTGGGTITIAEAIEDLDNDFVPDHLGETVTVEGVVFSPNYQTSNNSFYIHDGTAGTDIFMYGPPVYTWATGDMLQITGEVAQYNGMTEIIPADTSGWVLMSSGNPTPNPIVLTLAQYKANSEMYEGSLVGFVALNLVGGTWPGAGSSANLQLSDGVDTVTFRIDSDTDIDGSPEPTWPVDVIGIGSQFDNSPPYDGGYQIFPRFYATDFLPPGTIPVELTSFSARVNEGVVYLNWTTATEVNNSGFEVQRKMNNEFSKIGFVEGYGTTTEIHNYSFSEALADAGTHYYRLKQVDYDGSYSYSSVVEVKIVAPMNYALQQNYPNPFNPATKITFSLAVDSKVNLKVFDILGQEVVNLVNANMTAGSHEINFDASKLNSGVYFYSIDAAGVDGSGFHSVKKMVLTK